MTSEEVCAVLNELIQMDYDAIAYYRQAIERIDTPAVRDQLMIYQNDHVRHTMNLSDILRRLGRQPPERDDDATELATDGLVAIHSLAGPEETLKIMGANEKLVWKKYRQSTAMSLPIDIRAQIELNYHDEQRHLSYIETKLSQKASASSM